MTYTAAKPRLLLALIFCLLPLIGLTAEVDRFAGTYTGTAAVVYENETRQRDMSTTIVPTKDGFTLSWTSATYKSDGRTKEKTYEIEFVTSDRDHIYKSAMALNLFGQPTPLDPLQGEPFVWARFEGDTFSVYSLFINEIGDYEVQEFHRTLVEAGLDLVFLRIRNGAIEREIRTTLLRQN